MGRSLDRQHPILSVQAQQLREFYATATCRKLADCEPYAWQRTLQRRGRDQTVMDNLCSGQA
jgi:hypothetical protein